MSFLFQEQHKHKQKDAAELGPDSKFSIKVSRLLHERFTVLSTVF